MSDKVSTIALRAIACDIEDCEQPQSWADAMRAAVSEIEKLRTALNTFIAAVPKDCVLVSRVATDQMDARIVAFETENKKLRAALRKLYDHEGERVLNSIGIECYTVELEDALCEARAALGEKE